MQQSHTAWNTIAYLRRQNVTTRHVATQRPRQTRWIMQFGWSCWSACTMVESLRTWNNWSRSWSGVHCHRGSLMAVSTSGGIAFRLSYRRMVDILNTSSTSCQHLYSITVICCIRYKRWTICRSLTYDFFPSCLSAAVMLIVCGTI